MKAANLFRAIKLRTQQQLFLLSVYGVSMLFCFCMVCAMIRKASAKIVYRVVGGAAVAALAWYLLRWYVCEPDAMGFLHAA